MDAGGDFTLLTDEKFDFDISLSPTSAKEDNEDCDDEVFIGPVGLKEKCVSAVLKSQSSEENISPLNTDQMAWSPLSGDKFVEIFKEAHLLALQLECLAVDDQKKEEPPQTVTNPTVEKFVLGSKSKLNLLDAFNEINKTPVAIKRETYCIQDSPFHQLPPSFQQKLTGPNAKAKTSCGAESQNHSSPLKVPKLVKNHSLTPLALKTKTPQVKSAVPLSNIGKTVNILQTMKAPAVHTKNNRLAVEKPKAVKTSPARRKNLSSIGSTEDLLSDQSNIASDVSDSSFNASVVGPSKRTLPAPNKLGLNKAQFKTPSATVGFRKNTSSSSSSSLSSMNASLNSSLTFSPPVANAKLNSSLNSSLNTSVTNSRLKSNANRFALVRPLGVGSSVKNTTDLSNGHLKPGTAAKPAGNKSVSVSVSQPQTPAGKIQRQTSAPNLQKLPQPTKIESAVKGTNAKPQAKIVPTPTNRLKLPQKQDGLSPDRGVGKSVKPTQLLSCGEIGSTPLGTTKGMTNNSNTALRSIPATPNSKHVSALPTPISRRTSGIVTPRTIPRPVSSLRPATAVQASTKSAKKSPIGSPECELSKIKAARSPCSPIEEDYAASTTICCSLNFSPESKSDTVAQSEGKQSVSEKPSEVLLIDIEINKTDTKLRMQSSIDTESQPLIDLSNTPEFNKRLIPLKPANIGQLIDLSSPLIKLSPAGNKENVKYDSPLLKF